MFQSAEPTKTELNVLNKLSKNGLSEEVYEAVKFNDEPKIPTYLCVPNKEARKRYFLDDVYGCGISLNPTVAKIKAVAEFLERLAIFNPKGQNLIKKRYVKELCVDPRLFIHYSDIQMKSHKQRYGKLESGRYLWSSAVDYLTKKKVLVPAQLLYLSQIFREEVRIVPEQITTGAAFAKNPKAAFESGFLEVIERDAFMISYLTKRKLTRIINFPDEINNVINYLKRYYIDIFVFDVTTDLKIPTFMTIAVDKRGFGPAISTGMKSGFNAEDVISGSILESIQARRQARFTKEMEGNKFKFPKEYEIGSKLDRYFYWYPTKMIKHLDFWLKNDNTINFSKIPDYASSLNVGIEQLRDRGYHILYADISLNEIKKLGFVVGKVLIPELQPLYLSETSKVLYSIHGGNIRPSKNLKPHPFT
jgi:ribosomal protein S12 methylthiotransferase accessory factor